MVESDYSVSFLSLLEIKIERERETDREREELDNLLAQFCHQRS